MEVVAILAIGLNNELGKNNNLLWDLPRDMAFFKETTWGSCIITGRKNYESIPEKYRPLPGRYNIILSKSLSIDNPMACVAANLNEALEIAKSKGKETCYIIGGGQVYKQAFEADVVDKVLITVVEGNFNADVFLEGFNQEKWYLKTESFVPSDPKNPFNMRFQTWVRK
jgi:dihydrofolate reductase